MLTISDGAIPTEAIPPPHKAATIGRGLPAATGGGFMRFLLQSIAVRSLFALHLERIAVFMGRWKAPDGPAELSLR
jgi:hypothetical protein